MRKTFFSVHRIVHENWRIFFTVQHTWSFDIILCNPIEFLFTVKQWDIIKQLSIFRQLHSKIDWLKQQTISLIIFQWNTLERIIRQMLASLLKEYLITMCIVITHVSTRSFMMKFFVMVIWDIPLSVETWIRYGWTLDALTILKKFHRW